MRIARILPITRAEGPGKRFALWVQGCSIRCPGCFAKKLQDPEGGIGISLSEVMEQLEEVRDQVEGITLLGGEPMEQARELALLAEEAVRLDLSVITFTGYTYKKLLQEGSDWQKRLLRSTDILLSGPYVEAKRDFSRPLVGSSNQEILFLTNRYPKEAMENYKNRVEIRISKNGDLLLNGMGDLHGQRQGGRGLYGML